MTVSLETGAGQATIAYQQALNDAQNTKNALFRSYGITAPGADGAYSVESAQSAFDPRTLFTGSTFDQTKFDKATENLAIGGTGRLADIARTAATGEADVRAGMQARGLGDMGGGLGMQARQAIEEQGVKNLDIGKTEFLQSLTQGLAPIGSSFETLQANTMQDLYNGILSGILGDLWSPSLRKRK